MKLLQLLLIAPIIVLSACVFNKEPTCTFVNSTNRARNGSVQKESDREMIYAVDVVGDHAYIGIGNAFVVLDVEDPSNVKQLAELILTSGIESLDVIGEYAYVNGGSVSNEHHVIDVTDPSDPRAVNCLADASIPPLAGGTVAGGFAYVPAPHDGNLNIYEIGSESVVTVGSYQSFVPTRFRLGPDPELIPSEPIIVSDVAVIGEYAYVAENRVVEDEADFHAGRIHVLNIADPRRPRSVELYEFPEEVSISRILASNGSLFASTGSWDAFFTRVFDVSDPSGLIEVDRVQATEQLIGESNGHLFLKYIEPGARGIRVRKVEDITEWADWDESSWVYAMAADTIIVGDYAYFVGGGPAMAIIDVTDPMNPTLAGTYSYLREDDTE